MSMTRLTLTLAVVGSLAFVPAAGAMEPYLPKSQKSFDTVDADKNGKITAAEMTPKAGKRFDRFDADKSGDVTPAEIEAVLRAALEKQRDRILAALDADKNGTISRTEYDATVDKLVADADADKDGSLSMAEVRKSKVAKIVKPATSTGETSN
jgi:Ca2+-binding EF-hand superfamily protein